MIKRKWTDPAGRVWYVLRGTLAELGYPKQAGPSIAFEKALAEATHRRAPADAPPPAVSGPTRLDVQDLLYRARVESSE